MSHTTTTGAAIARADLAARIEWARARDYAKECGAKRFVVGGVMYDTLPVPQAPDQTTTGEKK